ncbi:hypothetical protein J4E81_007750 [Alternaria sp. BMP 2799]|nr:hypothetical protein J4E81_007750 [Alternaria sp. BMP 2799]
MRDSRAERYRTTMKYHRYGYAMFEPPDYSRLHPGMLGYLDENSHWHPLLDLTKADEVKAAGFGPLDTGILSDPDVCRWGPLESNTVKANEYGLESEADALALALPVEVGGVVEYSTSKDFGAVLICDDTVESQGFDLRAPFLAWLKKHSKALLARWPDIKKHGVVVATWTYSASKVNIQTWQNKDRKVTLGFTVGATGIGGLGPTRSWHRAGSSSAWSSWDDNKRVVFFTGVKIRYTLFGAREREEKKWRGGKEDEFLVPDLENGECAEAEVERFGDDWEEILRDREEESDAD